MSVDGTEKVYVELRYWDGTPRAGVADLEGAPHYFDNIFDDVADDYTDSYALWPASPEAVDLEREQWHIFVRWCERYAAGEVGTEVHPAHGGVDQRWDEIQRLLVPHHKAPSNALQFRATWEPIEGVPRYSDDGPDYRVRWESIDTG